MYLNVRCGDIVHFVVRLNSRELLNTRLTFVLRASSSDIHSSARADELSLSLSSTSFTNGKRSIINLARYRRLRSYLSNK